MTWQPRMTVRLRLTLWYAGAFFVAGALLLALNYFLVARSLAQRPVSGIRRVTDDFTRTAPHGGNTQELVSRLVAHAEKQRKETLDTLLVWSLLALLGVGVGAGLLGWLIGGRALSPLRQMTATARRVADNSLHERIALSGPSDEIKDLADTFDSMLERLDRSFDNQRRFVANAAHELRTPLAINRTLLEVALENPAAPEEMRYLGNTLLQVNSRHERLIDGLLALASSDQRISRQDRIDIADLVDYVIYSSAAREANIDIRKDISEATVLGDPVLLERMAQNLVDNALRYNLPTGGWLSISVAGTEGQAELTVSNSGPMVPSFEVEGLFEPFRRLSSSQRTAEPDETRPRGAGLGLSIVRSVVSAHGGNVQARALADGGLQVRVRLPLAS